MPCFNIRRLLPARMAWRVFSKKLQTKLHKLQRSKAIKKPNSSRLKSTNKAFLWPPALSCPSRRERRQRGPAKVLGIRAQIRKRTPPVYIDQLFVERAPAVVKGLQVGESSKIVSKVVDDQKISSLPAGTSERHTTSTSSSSSTPTPDDMWESLVLASPQMYGINERAEEFIARFRADMHKQEISAATHL